MFYSNKINVETINLFRAIKNGEKLNIIKELLEKDKTQVNYSLPPTLRERTCPLIYSVVTCNFEVIKLLINDSRTDINITDHFGSSSLIIIILNKNEIEFKSLKHKYIKVIKLLLSYQSFDVNTVNIGRQTALSLAIENEFEEAVKLLLDHPNINIIQPVESIVNISNKCNNQVIKKYLNNYIEKNKSTLDEQFEQQIADNYGNFQQMRLTLKRFDKICSKYIIENFNDLIKQFLVEKLSVSQNISKDDLMLKTSNFENKKDISLVSKEKSKCNKKLKRKQKKQQLKLFQLRQQFWKLSIKKRIFDLRKKTQVINNWHYLNYKINQSQIKEKQITIKQHILAYLKLQNVVLNKCFKIFYFHIQDKKTNDILKLKSEEFVQKITNKNLLESLEGFKKYFYKMKLQTEQENLIIKFIENKRIKLFRNIFESLHIYLKNQVKNKTIKMKKNIKDKRKDKKNISLKNLPDKYNCQLNKDLTLNSYEFNNSNFIWVEDRKHYGCWYIVKENYYLEFINLQNYYKSQHHSIYYKHHSNQYYNNFLHFNTNNPNNFNFVY